MFLILSWSACQVNHRSLPVSPHTVHIASSSQHEDQVFHILQMSLDRIHHYCSLFSVAPACVLLKVVLVLAPIESHIQWNLPLAVDSWAVVVALTWLRDSLGMFPGGILSSFLFHFVDCTFIYSTWSCRVPVGFVGTPWTLCALSASSWCSLLFCVETFYVISRTVSVSLTFLYFFVVPLWSG